MSGFQTVQNLKFFRSSGPDVMSGRTLIMPMVICVVKFLSREYKININIAMCADFFRSNKGFGRLGFGPQGFAGVRPVGDSARWGSAR